MAKEQPTNYEHREASADDRAKRERERVGYPDGEDRWTNEKPTGMRFSFRFDAQDIRFIEVLDRTLRASFEWIS